MSKPKAKPKCAFVDKGGAACDVTLPKPNQLCPACRPHWAARRRGSVLKP